MTLIVIFRFVSFIKYEKNDLNVTLKCDKIILKNQKEKR